MQSLLPATCVEIRRIIRLHRHIGGACGDRRPSRQVTVFRDLTRVASLHLSGTRIFGRKTAESDGPECRLRWTPNCHELLTGCSRCPGRYLRHWTRGPRLSMTFIVAAVLGGLAILVAAIAGLLVQRRALRESVEQFRLISDQAPVLIWTARPDTTLDYLNGFCVQLTGRPLEELREKGWLDFVHPEDVDRCLGTYMPAFEARRPFLLDIPAAPCRRRGPAGFWLPGVPRHGRDGMFTSGFVSAAILRRQVCQS